MVEPRWDLGAVVVFQSYHDTWSSAADPSYHLFWATTVRWADGAFWWEQETILVDGSGVALIGLGRRDGWDEQPLVGVGVRR